MANKINPPSPPFEKGGQGGFVNKIRVAILYGGRSGEHEVSLQSAAAVVRNLDSTRFDITPIGIDKQGRWLLNDIKKAFPEGSLSLQIVDGDEIEKNQFKSFDVIFPVLHGALCEDGTIQGMLELMDIPYVGAGVLASALGMDKDVSKRLVAAGGLSVSSYITINQGIWQNKPDDCYKEIDHKLRYPIFVKPINSGSSVGVHKVKRADELTQAINDAFLYDTRVIIEQGMNIREIELSVLESLNYGESPLVSIPGEIIPTHEFYSYAAKYLDADGAKLVIPAALTEKQIQQVQEMAGKIFTILNCEGMARVDLFMDKESGEFIFNEVNTIPGFTQISMYPKLWEASGLAYRDLLTHLIELAIARDRRKQALKRDWALPAT